MGLVAPWHVGSSQTRARTRVPCIGRQILNHCATREAPSCTFFDKCTEKCIYPSSIQNNAITLKLLCASLCSPLLTHSTVLLCLKFAYAPLLVSDSSNERWLKCLLFCEFHLLHSYLPSHSTHIATQIIIITKVPIVL